jgi:hypothetical protein
MWYRCLSLPALLLSGLTAGAVTLDVARLPAPSFADGEVSGDAALPSGRTNDLRTFRLEMTFDATPSNNVQVAFGRDNLPADGFLAAEETDCIIGWDCGEWFLRPQGLADRHTFTPGTAEGRRTLTMEIPVSLMGVPKPAAFRDGAEAFTFPGLALSPVPEWLAPGLWTHLQVTARGHTGTNETVRARFLPDGARIILK